MIRKLTDEEKLKLKYLKECLKLHGKTKKFPTNFFFYLFQKSYLDWFIKGLEMFLKMSVKDFEIELKSYKYKLDKLNEKELKNGRQS